MPISAAERQRRRRARQEAEALALRVDVPQALEAELVAAGYLLPDGVGEPEALRTAISDFLEDLSEIGLEGLSQCDSGCPA